MKLMELALPLHGRDFVVIIPNFIDSWNVFWNQEIEVLDQFCETRNMIVDNIQVVDSRSLKNSNPINKCPDKSLHELDLVIGNRRGKKNHTSSTQFSWTWI